MIEKFSTEIMILLWDWKVKIKWFHNDTPAPKRVDFSGVRLFCLKNAQIVNSMKNKWKILVGNKQKLFFRVYYCTQNYTNKLLVPLLNLGIKFNRFQNSNGAPERINKSH